MTEFCPCGECPQCGRVLEECHVKRRCPRGSTAVGLGDYVEKALSSIGITKERVEKVLGKPCRCQERQEALNRLGRRLTSTPQK